MEISFSSKLLHKLRIKSAQNRVVLACACFMFISMMIIGIYTYTIMYGKLFQQKSDEMKMYAQKTVGNLEQVFSFASNTAMAVATSETIMEWLDTPLTFHEENSGYYEHVYELKDEIMHILAYSNAWKNDYISYIAVFSNDEMLMYSASKPMAESTIKKTAGEIYTKSRNSEEGLLDGKRFMVGNGMIYHIRTMKPVFEGEESLSIMIAIDEKSLRRQYSETEVMKTYLIDSDGTIFSSSQEDEGGKSCDKDLMEVLEKGESRVKLKNTTYMCEAKPLDGVGLTFLSLMPRNEIIRQAFSGMPVYIAISGALCCLLLAVGVVISLRSTSFIRDMAQGMEEIKKKNYDVKMPHYNNEAVDYLSDSFNSMTESMKILVRDTYESKIMLQEMQLEFLQQQVNPHFLFNILLTIQVKAKMCSDESVYNMLASLSGFLRAGLYFSQNTFTTLGAEVEYIQFYLYLQQQRFEEKLQYVIQIPEELLKWEIPRLTIEPLVENAVVHGAENVDSLVTVMVSAKIAGDDLEIVVEDDGGGFCAEDLNLEDRVIEEGEQLENMTRDKIGVRNTNSRLKLLYGDAYGLKINSEIGKGTRVVVHIPKKTNKRLEG
ncbi:MAG: histidine kinase [Eubacteriales bacterium]|nr:histidine kinase [Eubacteriales bacterium]